MYVLDMVHTAICSRFLLDFTIQTTRISNFEHFRTFKEGVLGLPQSQELCSEFGWDTASGISREQFEDLVGDGWVGWTGGYQLLLWTDFQYLSMKTMKLLNILE